MKKVEYLTDHQVQGFIGWLNVNVDNILIHLKIKKSKFVTGPVNVKCYGLNEVIKNYNWRSSWRDNASNVDIISENWIETKSSLKRLSNLLNDGIQAQNHDLVFNTCKSILDWGGDRTVKKGATPQINDLHKQKLLIEYLEKARAVFDGAEITKNKISKVQFTGSMWTKIYALSSKTGSPIYDSRVAAAAASLVNIFSRSKMVSLHDRSDLLCFPVPSNEERRNKILIGNNTYSFNRLVNNSIEWTDATIRLSWIMDEVLKENSTLFGSEETTNDRKHAFEAALFMVGYDTGSLVGFGETSQAICADDYG